MLEEDKNKSICERSSEKQDNPPIIIPIKEVEDSQIREEVNNCECNEKK